MNLKDAVAEERVDAGEGFGGVEGGGAGGDAVGRERGLRGGRDGLLRERMRQCFERGIVVEREVHAFVGFDEDEDANLFVRSMQGNSRSLANAP